MSDQIKNLNRQKCKACTKETPALKGNQLRRYYISLEEGWELVDNHHLEKDYSFKNFKDALNFTIDIGEMSEEEGHHPQIYLTWGKVNLIIYTHVIDTLSENDFIWAAKADELYENYSNS